MNTEKFKNTYRIESARLRGWDYGSNAAYFVTICTADQNHYFGEIRDGIMHLSEIGEIAQAYWQEIPQHFHFVGFGSYVIMPNHVHGIVIIDKPDCAFGINTDYGDGNGCRDVACNVSTISGQSPRTTTNDQMSSISPKPGSLSTIIRSYKSAVTKRAHLVNPSFTWQPRYHDHIIRNPESDYSIAQYIQNNVKNWAMDRFYNSDKMSIV
ncbi:MAG: transposase [Candidatus Marinimicrobia bacterium]|nr:transposase [Candidatus Neomarinimicrobiota bacterium]